MDTSTTGHIAPVDLEAVQEARHEPAEWEKTLALTTSRQTQNSTVSRGVLSRFRTAESIPMTPPPDGGFEAWSQAFLACLVNLNTWGFANTFGVFQTYYVDTMHIGPPSAVAWIGSLHVFLVFGVGTFSGRATDAGYFYLTYWAGVVLYCFGLLMLSFCDQYWQILLTHGLCVGLGAGLGFVPSLAVTASYFSHAKRPMALAVVVAGSSAGGLIFPAVAEQMLSKNGFGWTIRTIFFLQLGLAAVAGVFMKPRLPPRKTGPIIEWASFKELPYTFYLIGSFLAFSGVYISFFYVGSFGRDILGTPHATSIQLLLTMNGVGLPARLLPNLVGQKLVGPLNLIIPYTVATGIVLFSWMAVESVTALWVWAVMIGVIAAGIHALFPVVLTSLTDDPKKMGVRSGMGFTVVGTAVLIGPPIAGALVERLDGDYWGLQVFGGCTMLLAAGFQLAARWAKVGWQFKVKI